LPPLALAMTGDSVEDASSMYALCTRPPAKKPAQAPSLLEFDESSAVRAPRVRSSDRVPFARALMTGHDAEVGPVA
jgi:hypothetical protein